MREIVLGSIEWVGEDLGMGIRLGEVDGVRYEEIGGMMDCGVGRVG